MKRIQIIATAFAFVYFIQSPALTSAASPAPSAPSSVVLKLDQTIPESLYLVKGQIVAFQFGQPTRSTFSAIGKNTDGKGELLKRLHNNTLNQLAAFKAQRVGDGELRLSERPVQGASKTKTIKVKVFVDVKEMTLADNGKNVTVSKDTLVVVKLRGNITTGHAWKLYNNTGKKSVQQLGKDEYVDDPGNGLGQSGTFVFSFNASAAGQAELDLAYAAGKALPQKKFNVKLTVNP